MLEAHDSEHRFMGDGYQFLGTLYDKQGRRADAEKQFQHALQVRERTGVPEHLEIAESLQALGVLYKELGRFDAAEPLLMRWAIRKQGAGAGSSGQQGDQFHFGRDVAQEPRGIDEIRDDPVWDYFDELAPIGP
ncbi:tetratricopeptide repeat protein [Massilia sp. H-1]|nr:tetratricopeptide repeat protein [Massilia sp. H-1]